MKACFKCGGTFPLEAFYRHPQMADGHLGKCKECAKADVRAHYRRTFEKRAQYERERFKEPARKAANAHYSRVHRQRHPQHYKARAAVNNEIRAGRLRRLPCEACGAAKSEAHHPDYSRPLDVRWLCLPHHRQAEGR